MLALLQVHTRTVEVEMRYSLLGWLLIGLIAGWLAGKIARGRGFGCITDIILGLVGGVLGGWIFSRLGIVGYGFLFSLAAATLRAVILLAIVHLFSPGPQELLEVRRSCPVSPELRGEPPRAAAFTREPLTTNSRQVPPSEQTVIPRQAH